MPSTLNSLISKGKMSSENAVSSHRGLISFETVYETEKGNFLGRLREKNLISLHSAAFDTIFVCNLAHSHKFHVNFEIA